MTVTMVLTWLQMNSLVEEPLSGISASNPPGAMITLGASDMRLLLMRRGPPIMHLGRAASATTSRQSQYKLDLYWMLEEWIDITLNISSPYLSMFWG